MIGTGYLRLAFIAALAVVGAQGAVAGAEAAPDGFSHAGQVELARTVARDDLPGIGLDEDFETLILDADLRWRAAGGGAVRLGFDLGLEAFSTSGVILGDERLSAVFGALVLETEFGTVSLGAPRGVLGEMFDMPRVGGGYAFDARLRSARSGAFAVQSLLFDGQSYGLRYDHAAEGLQFGASYHVIPEGNSGPDWEYTQAALAYRGGTFGVTAGYEHIDRNADSQEKLFLGATAERGPVAGGLVLVADRLGSFRNTWNYAFASVEVLPEFTVTGTYTNRFLENAGERHSGIDAEYRFGPAFLRGGYARSTRGTEVLDLSVGYRF